MHRSEFNASRNNEFLVWTLEQIQPRPRGKRKRKDAGFPPLAVEEKLQVQVYRRYKRRKSPSCRFSSSHRGGKLAGAALPPLVAAVKLQPGSLPFRCRLPFPFSPFFSLTGTWGAQEPFLLSFPAPCTHHHGGTRLMAHPNGLHVEDAVESGRSRVLLRFAGIISIRVNLGAAREIAGRST